MVLLNAYYYADEILQQCIITILLSVKKNKKDNKLSYQPAFWATSRR